MNALTVLQFDSKLFSLVDSVLTGVLKVIKLAIDEKIWIRIIHLSIL